MCLDRRRLWTLLSLVCLALLAGCVLPANVVVDLPDDEGQTGRVVVSNANGDTELSRPMAAVGLHIGAPPGQPFITDPGAIKKVFGKVLEATPRKPVSFVIYFAPGSAQVATASRVDLARAIDAAKAMSYPEVSIIEHSDPASPAGQNDPLMLARGQSIANTLVGAGISPAAVDIENYGPATPLPDRPGGSQPNVPIEISIR